MIKNHNKNIIFYKKNHVASSYLSGWALTGRILNPRSPWPDQVRGVSSTFRCSSFLAFGGFIIYLINKDLTTILLAVFPIFELNPKIGKSIKNKIVYISCYNESFPYEPNSQWFILAVFNNIRNWFQWWKVRIVHWTKLSDQVVLLYACFSSWWT